MDNIDLLRAKAENLPAAERRAVEKFLSEMENKSLREELDDLRTDVDLLLKDKNLRDIGMAESRRRPVERADSVFDQRLNVDPIEFNSNSRDTGSQTFPRISIPNEPHFNPDLFDPPKQKKGGIWNANTMIAAGVVGFILVFVLVFLLLG
jgi:hypothetical protein